MKAIVKLYHIISFIVYYLWEVLLSNISIAVDILTPKHRMTPGIVDLKLSVTREGEILAISNLISMTPGTLALDYDREKNSMRIHAMYYDNPDEFIQSMNRLQSKIHKIFN
jgi:multicomponent Na+:H+ antiporter subunit E